MKVDGPARETFAAQLTPPGRGAVATIGVRGPRATEIVDARLRLSRGGSLRQRGEGAIVLGAWDGAGEGKEELVAVRWGEEGVDLHCHGGTAAPAAVLETLVAGGAQAVGWQEWVGRTEENRLSAAAKVCLAKATTARTAEILLGQYRGALRRDWGAAVERLRQGDAEGGRQAIEELLARGEFGRRLTSGWRLAVVGPPNVGKSTLVNALLGYERSIAYDLPGTTRDVVTGQTALDGWPVEVADTAGLRAGGEALEAEGMARGVASAAGADCVLWLEDVRKVDAGDASEAGWGAGGAEWWNEVGDRRRIVRVYNKVDLIAPAAVEALRARHSADEDPPQVVSAKSGAGIERLLQVVVERLVPTPWSGETGVPITGEQTAALTLALEQCNAGDLEGGVATLARFLEATGVGAGRG